MFSSSGAGGLVTVHSQATSGAPTPPPSPAPWEVSKGPPRRVNLENAVGQLFAQSDPLPWTLKFLSGTREPFQEAGQDRGWPK